MRYGSRADPAGRDRICGSKPVVALWAIIYSLVNNEHLDRVARITNALR
ncbi:MAG: hypothetical protein IPM49_01230 [Flavobacteriales bacterium]|nr:hypothetical protein [Flavobacteriales bacterium]